MSVAGIPAGAVSWLQVTAQLAGIALAVWPWHEPHRGPWWVLVASAAGAALGAWTLLHNRPGNFSVFPEPRARAVLVTTGPYARVRHPMYGALILVLAGVAAWHGHPLNVAGLALATAAVAAKALREERFLRARFPGYEAYCRRTRRFL